MNAFVLYFYSFLLTFVPALWYIVIWQSVEIHAWDLIYYLVLPTGKLTPFISLYCQQVYALWLIIRLIEFQNNKTPYDSINEYSFDSKKMREKKKAVKQLLTVKRSVFELIQKEDKMKYLKMHIGWTQFKWKCRWFCLHKTYQFRSNKTV